MNKKLNEDALKNELAGSAFFVRTEPTDSPTPPVPKPAKPVTAKAEKKPVDQPVDQSTSQSTDQSTDKKVIDQTAVLGRPKAFYITEKQDRDLDTLVAEISLKLAGKLQFKVDRSILIRLILESSDLTSEEHIDRLSSRLVSRSISQLSG